MSFFDPDKSKPASIYPTIALLNNFLVNSHQFLNAFSENVEKKISSVSTKITQLEILLSIVEAKLNSIPDTGDASSTPAQDEHKTNDISSSLSKPNTSIPPPPPLPSNPTRDTGNEEAQMESDASNVVASAPSSALPEGKVEASNHPSYIPFLKMLKVGVPGPVVANKLQSVGLDPSVVDNPSKLVDV
jgi:hypothetical protein